MACHHPLGPIQLKAEIQFNKLTSIFGNSVGSDIDERFREKWIIAIRTLRKICWSLAGGNEASVERRFMDQTSIPSGRLDLLMESGWSDLNGR